MRIVVYGAARRVGALVGDHIVDLNRAFARYLRERRSGADPEGQADDRQPADLERFISLGAAALEDAQEALTYLTASGTATTDDVAQPRAGVKLSW